MEVGLLVPPKLYRIPTHLTAQVESVHLAVQAAIFQKVDVAAGFRKVPAAHIHQA
jgi:hypothetical protein